MSKVDTPEVARLRGFRKITEFLRRELGEPDLPETRVKSWANSGKLTLDRFGANVTATPAGLRANLAGRTVASD